MKEFQEATPEQIAAAAEHVSQSLINHARDITEGDPRLSAMAMTSAAAAMCHSLGIDRQGLTKYINDLFDRYDKIDAMIAKGKAGQ